MIQRATYQPANPGVPKASLVIAAGGCHNVTIRTKNAMTHYITVTQRRTRWQSGGRIPNHGGLIVAGRQNLLAIRAITQTGNYVGMLEGCADSLARSRIP